MKYRSSLLLIFLLAGCITSFKIVIDGTDPFRPVFRPEETFWNFLRVDTFYIESLYIGMYDIENGRFTKTIWHFGKKNSKGRELKKVVYGETPTGFKEVTQPEKLLPETDYAVEASGWGGGGDAIFRIVRERESGYRLKVYTDKELTERIQKFRGRY